MITKIKLWLWVVGAAIASIVALYFRGYSRGKRVGSTESMAKHYKEEIKKAKDSGNTQRIREITLELLR